MTRLVRLSVQNFRSLEDVNVEIGPITVFFGATAAGKSSLFYSLLALRNFILNPNQASDGFFNLGFQNLGGFDACVFNHAVDKPVRVLTVFADDSVSASYGIGLTKNEADISAFVNNLDLKAHVPIPYAINQSWTFNYRDSGNEYTVNWNGIFANVAPAAPSTESQAGAMEIATRANSAVEALKRVDICPHRRGFFKPSYSLVSPGSMPTTEDEVASLIINDQHAPSRISIDTSEIFGRDFRTYTPPGTAVTFLQTTELKGARVPGLLVNDGFGVNQVVYMLAKIHRQDVTTVLIEEPEVHLHPSVVRSFAKVLVRLAMEEGKQLIFTTHSEQFLLSLLACVGTGQLAAKDLVCYHAHRPAKSTSFERAPVSDQGQIAGGLSSFMQSELEDIKSFLKIP